MTTSLKWCTYNIIHHGAGRIYQCLHQMDEMNFDFGILTEVKVTATTRLPTSYMGYRIACSGENGSNNQGGVLLFYKDDPNRFSVESVKAYGPNVISFVLVSGNKRWTVVGVYIPPTENDGCTLRQIGLAFHDARDMELLLAGDINVDLRQTAYTARDNEIATILAAAGLIDVSRHFLQPHHHRHGWTWRRKNARDGVVKARCDVVMGTDRRSFRSMRIIDPPRYDSDHYLLAATLWANKPKEHQEYLRGRKAIPPTGNANLKTEVSDSRFTELLRYKHDQKTPTNNGHRPDWISEATWLLMNRRLQLTKSGKLTARRRKQLKRQVQSSLRRDRKKRAEEAGKMIETLLGSGDYSGAWDVAKRWYQKITGRQPPPAREALNETSDTYEELYRQSHPPGDPLPTPTGIHINVRDDPPSENETIQHIRRLRNDKAPGASGLRAEDLKRWVAQHETEGGDKRPFQLLMELIRAAYGGDIPQALNLAILVLIPKPNTKEYRGIGLLEVIWKLLSSIVDGRLKETVEFDDAIHGFRSKRGTGTAILTHKLRMQNATVMGSPVRHVYLDLKKAYDTLDRERTLAILRSYKMGPNNLRLLGTFWDRHMVVPRAGGYHGRAFRATRGVTQGDVVSPMIFNIVLDCIIKTWRSENPELAAAVSAIFYADDGELSSENAFALQMSVDKFTALFNRVGLRMNAAKTKLLVSNPRKLAHGISSPAYHFRMTGVGLNERERRSQRAICEICGKEFRKTSIPRHKETAHQVYHDSRPSLSRRLFGPGLEYRVESISRSGVRVNCPIPDCPGGATRADDMRSHFAVRHPEDSIWILDESDAPLPRCQLCGKQVLARCLQGHGRTVKCKKGQTAKAKRLMEMRIREAENDTFTVDGVPIEKVDKFKYLGRPILANDSDVGCIRYNITKARAKWQMLARILTRENATPKVMGMFYKAVVMSVLLYGSETWVIRLTDYDILNSFHTAAARKISRLHFRFNSETEAWDRPPAEAALERSGLAPLITYLRRRRVHIVPYADTLPEAITLRERGVTMETVRKKFWTDDMDLTKLSDLLKQRDD